MTSTAEATAPSASPVLLDARNVRIEIDGAAAIASLDMVSRGTRLLCLGSTTPLVAALAGVRPRSEDPQAPPIVAAVTSGTLRVMGCDVASGSHRAVLGVALMAPPIPAKWRVGEYVSWCARLDGASRHASRALTAAAMATLSLESIKKSRLASLSPLERRVVVLAGAIVSQPAAVLVDEPLTGLDAREAGLMLRALGLATSGRAAIATAPRVRLDDASGQLATGASDVSLFRGGALVVHTDPKSLLSEGRLFEVTVTGRGPELQAELELAGLHLRGGPRHYSVVLPDGVGPRTLLAASSRVAAPIASCVPLVG